jgi:predicted RNA-binding Zn-ribbon protein involved in translation (DUF1610 family)
MRRWRILFGEGNRTTSRSARDEGVMAVPEFVKLIERNAPHGGLLFVTQDRKVRCSSCGSTVDADGCLETSTSVGAVRLSCPSCGEVWHMVSSGR